MAFLVKLASLAPYIAGAMMFVTTVLIGFELSPIMGVISIPIGILVAKVVFEIFKLSGMFYVAIIFWFGVTVKYFLKIIKKIFTKNPRNE